MTEERPNPYNRNKEWQEGVENEFVDSDSLFRPTATVDPEGSTDPDANLQPDPYKTRYDELKKHHDAKLRDFKQEIEQLRAEVKVEAQYAPPRTTEEIEAFKEKNPEIYEVMESQIHNQTKEATAKLEKLDLREKNLLKREALSELTKAHSDIEDIKVDPAFHNWAEEQPQTIQDWIYKNPYDGVLAAKAITLYKTEKGIGTKEQDNDLEKAVVQDDFSALFPTRSSGANTTPEKKIWKESEIAKMSMNQYERYETEILAAEEEGRIVRG
jgi:hypothetical protein